MKTSLTKDDIPEYDPENIDLGDGYTLKIETKSDEYMGPPWKEHDGHGPVSEWTTRDKHPGEVILCDDHRQKRYYDFAAAIELAKKDGWDAPPYKTGTPGETADRAVKADFKRLQDWCYNRWQWIYIVVTLLDSNGKEISRDSLGGVESDGDYWRECAAEMGTTLIEELLEELSEANYWAARDVITL